MNPAGDLNPAELARTVEGLNKHLAFAKETLEAGWNARDERGRGFNFQASLKTLENVMTENEFLIDRLYKAAKPAKGK